MHLIMTLLKALKKEKVLWAKGGCQHMDKQQFKRQKMEELEGVFLGVEGSQQLASQYVK